MSGIRYIRAVFRSCSRRVCYERAILHHAARSGNERRQTFRLLHLPRVTAFARLDRGNFSRHRGITATQQTAAGHPDRNADRQQQSHRFVREEQTHSLAVYSPGVLIVEVRTRIKIVIKFQHFCNGLLVSLKI